MSVKPLPPSPHLDHYRKQARALQRAVRAGDPSAIDRVRRLLPNLAPDAGFALSDAQWVLAREHGFASWPKLKQQVEAMRKSGDSGQISSQTDKETIMGEHKTAPRGGNIGDEAVLAKTGKVWAEWFAILDAAGADRLSHKEIVSILRDQHGVGSWWQQMVTVQYEQSRGLRVLNQSCDGDYQVNVSKTISVPAVEVFDAWNNTTIRETWLPGANLTIRKATSPKSLRITWHEGGSLDVMIYPKGDAKCSCTADHKKLASAESVEHMRTYWSGALTRLKEKLEAE